MFCTMSSSSSSLSLFLARISLPFLNGPTPAAGSVWSCLCTLYSISRVSGTCRIPSTHLHCILYSNTIFALSIDEVVDAFCLLFPTFDETIFLVICLRVAGCETWYLYLRVCVRGVRGVRGVLETFHASFSFHGRLNDGIWNIELSVSCLHRWTDEDDIRRK